ncbi:hypothetical protein [Enterococcus larvae]|uniref:hypothetical protein n=1 Tax=Enterococcus larvae TaxID=2794352 RepID=UPI003F2ABF0A
MSKNIVSSTGAAQQAVSKLTGKDLSGNGQVVSFSGSDVASMTDGLIVANQLISDVSNLAECVWSQASKFPQIAETLANKDNQAAHQFGGTVY